MNIFDKKTQGIDMNIKIKTLMLLGALSLTDTTYCMLPSAESLKSAGKEVCKKTWERIQDNKGAIGTGICTAALTFGAYKLYLSNQGQSIACERNDVCATAASAEHDNELPQHDSAAAAADTGAYDTFRASEELSPWSASDASIDSSLLYEGVNTVRSVSTSDVFSSTCSARPAELSDDEQDEFTDEESDSSSAYLTPQETPTTSPTTEHHTFELNAEELTLRLAPIAKQRQYGFELDLSALQV